MAGRKGKWFDTVEGKTHVARLIQRSGAVLELQARQVLSGCIQDALVRQPDLPFTGEPKPWTYDEVDYSKELEETSSHHGWKLVRAFPFEESSGTMREIDFELGLWTTFVESSIWGECKFRDGLEAFVIPSARENAIMLPLYDDRNPPGSYPADKEPVWLKTASTMPFTQLTSDGVRISDRVVFLTTSQFEKPSDPKLLEEQLLQNAGRQVLDAIRDYQLLRIVIGNHPDYCEPPELHSQERKVPSLCLDLPVVVLNGLMWAVHLDERQQIADYKPITHFVYQLSLSGKLRDLFLASSHAAGRGLGTDYTSILVCSLEGLALVFRKWLDITLTLGETIGGARI